MKTSKKKPAAEKKTSETRKSRKPGGTVPDNACPYCGSLMVEKCSKVSHPVNGEEVSVPRVPHLRCPDCDEIMFRLEEARQLRKRALEIYRQDRGLLSSDEIRSIRERLGMSQAEFAKLLRLGANTVSRWESGRNVQNAAMDTLLRLLRDVPETFTYLENHAA